MNPQKRISFLINQDQLLRSRFQSSLNSGFIYLATAKPKLSPRQWAIIVCLLETIGSDDQLSYYNQAGKTDPQLTKQIQKFLADNQIIPTGHYIDLAKKITEPIMAQIELWPEIMKTEAKKQLTRTKTRDQEQEISLLTHRFFASLDPKWQSLVEPSLPIKLGRINYLLWTAYTIFDDIIDQEIDPMTLVIGLEFLRLANNLLGGIKVSPETKKMIDVIFSDLNQGQMITAKTTIELARKSLAPALGPLIILEALPILERSSNQKNWLNYMRCYHGLRQLHDDLRDRKEDQISGNDNYLNRQLNGDLPRAEKEINLLVAAGKKYLAQITALTTKQYFHRLLDKCLIGRNNKERQLFIRHYYDLKSRIE